MTPAIGPSSPVATPDSPSVGVSSLAWLLVAAVLCGCVLAAGILAQITWARGTPDIAGPTTQAILAVLVATGIGHTLFALTTARTPASAAFGLLAGSMVRMFVGLSIALLMFFLGGFEKSAGTVFWIVFLSGGLAAILAEAAWGVKNLPRIIASSASTGTPSRTPTPSGPAPSETH